jgi:predicted DNA-binding antitoxin AbrB/MazE fold protein
MMKTKLAKKKIEITSGTEVKRQFAAVFENGVLKPLKRVRLPKSKKLIVIVHVQKQSIAEQMYGLCKPKNQVQLDAIIESEEWL